MECYQQEKIMAPNNEIFQERWTHVWFFFLALKNSLVEEETLPFVSIRVVVAIIL